MAEPILAQLKDVYDKAGDINSCVWFRNWALSKQSHRRWQPFYTWVKQHLKTVDKEFAKVIVNSFVKVDTHLFPRTWGEWFGSAHISTNNQRDVVSEKKIRDVIRGYSTAWATELLPDTFTGNVSFIGSRPLGSTTIITIMELDASDEPKVSSEVSENNSIIIYVPPFSFDNDRTLALDNQYREWVKGAKAQLVKAFEEHNKQTGAPTVYVSMGPSASWWSIDYAFVAFCAAHGFFEKNTETSMSVNIELNGVPSVRIKYDAANEKYKKQLDLGVEAYRAQPEHLFWWGKWNVLTEQHYNCPGNCHHFGVIFEERQCTSALEAFVAHSLSANSLSANSLRDIADESSMADTLVAKCSNFRINLADFTNFIHTWLTSHDTADNLYSSEVEYDFIIGPSIQYRDAPNNKNNCFSVQGFETIHTTDGCTAIFGEVRNGNDVQELWRDLASNGCGFRNLTTSSAILIPEQHFMPISPLTFYYIFVAIGSRGGNALPPCTIFIRLTEDYKPIDAGLFKTMCIMGYELFTNNYPNNEYPWKDKLDFRFYVPVDDDLRNDILDFSTDGTTTQTYAPSVLKAMFMIIDRAQGMLQTTIENRANQAIVEDIWYSDEPPETEGVSDALNTADSTKQYSNELKETDVNRLLPGGELNNLIITQYAKELLEAAVDKASVYIFDAKYGQELMTKSNPSFVTNELKITLAKCSSFVIPTLIDAENGVAPPSPPKEKKKGRRKNPNPKRRIVSGISRHWVCFYYQKDTSTFYYFDSMGEKVVTDHMRSEYYETLKNNFVSLGIINAGAQTTLNVVANLPQQNDACSSGVFVLAYIETILKSPHARTFQIDNDFFDVEDYRRQLFGWAQHGKYPSLDGILNPFRMKVALDIYRCPSSGEEARSRTFYAHGNSYYIKHSKGEKAGFGLFAAKPIEKGTALLDPNDRTKRLKEFGVWLLFHAEEAEDPEVFQSTPEDLDLPDVNDDELSEDERDKRWAEREEKIKKYRKRVFEPESEVELKKCWGEVRNEWAQDIHIIDERMKGADIKPFLDTYFYIHPEENKNGNDSHPYAMMFNHIGYEEVEYAPGKKKYYDEAQWCDPYDTLWGFMNDPRGIMTELSDTKGDGNVKHSVGLGDEDFDDITQFVTNAPILADGELYWNYGPDYDFS